MELYRVILINLVIIYHKVSNSNDHFLCEFVKYTCK